MIDWGGGAHLDLKMGHHRWGFGWKYVVKRVAENFGRQRERNGREVSLLGHVPPPPLTSYLPVVPRLGLQLPSDHGRHPLTINPLFHRHRRRSITLFSPSFSPSYHVFLPLQCLGGRTLPSLLTLPPLRLRRGAVSPVPPSFVICGTVTLMHL